MIPSWRLSRHSDCFPNPTSRRTEFLAHSSTSDVYDVETRVSRSRPSATTDSEKFCGGIVTLCLTTVGYTSKRRTSRVLHVDWNEVNNVTFGWHRGDDARTHLSSCHGNAWTDQNRSWTEVPWKLLYGMLQGAVLGFPKFDSFKLYQFPRPSTKHHFSLVVSPHIYPPLIVPRTLNFNAIFIPKFALQSSRMGPCPPMSR